MGIKERRILVSVVGRGKGKGLPSYLICMPV